MSLVSASFVEELSRVRDFGVRKHGLDSHTLYPSELYVDAILRHLSAYRKGERLDQETGFHHLAHVSINCMFLIERDDKSVWAKIRRWLRTKK